ncbi:helix-turn-helix domain-containing protein [Roseivivax jejudonensis]|uniref:helix-turn-helix domain-containing protein n=1 Tax=Roseivivax jejudonensis TaxID=1529041 RepID=UPI000A2717F3|nr:helix-turn-helix transcriptional regulator [Roseivivax jejudonensis]
MAERAVSISGAQIRMAKAALGLSNPQLAEKTGLHRNTLNRAERGEGRAATFDHLRRFFEAEGVVFVPENGGPEGIRFAQIQSKGDEGV